MHQLREKQSKGLKQGGYKVTIPRQKARRNMLAILTIFILVLLCTFAFTACSSDANKNEIANYVEGTCRFTTTYDVASDTTRIAISMEFENKTKSIVKQTVITFKYFMSGVEQGTVVIPSQNALGYSSFLDEIEKEETKTLLFFATILGQADEVQRVGEVFKYESNNANKIDTALLVALIGSGFSTLIAIVSIVFNFTNAKRIEDHRINRANENLRRQEKAKVYLELYKLYYYYANDYDVDGRNISELSKELKKVKSNLVLDKIMVVVLELDIYGSEKMKNLVEKIKWSDGTFKKEDLDNFENEIRKELGESNG
jgi:hypothetical protein